MREARTAVGHELRAQYLPTLAQPLPSGIKLLVAQLVALESARRQSAETPVEALLPAHAPR
jgi:hypothetical protein